MIPVEWPAGPGYPAPSSYEAELDKAQAELEEELASQADWIGLGQKNGVQLSKKNDRADNGQLLTPTVAVVGARRQQRVVGLQEVHASE
jgi:hypothetical protein